MISKLKKLNKKIKKAIKNKNANKILKLKTKRKILKVKIAKLKEKIKTFKKALLKGSKPKSKLMIFIKIEIKRVTTKLKKQKNTKKKIATKK